MAATRVEQLRKLAKALSQDGKLEVTSQALCAELGVTDVETKALVRRSITHMVRHGELERIASGRFLYKAGAAAAMERAGESFRRMWRIIRTENTGWSIAGVAALTRLHQATVSGYCRWLITEGYITICGKRGNTRLFRATDKARQQRETPYPPAAPEDIFSKLRNAANRLNRMMMEPNPDVCREGILAECRAIVAHFEEEGRIHAE